MGLSSELQPWRSDARADEKENKLHDIRMRVAASGGLRYKRAKQPSIILRKLPPCVPHVSFSGQALKLPNSTYALMWRAPKSTCAPIQAWQFYIDKMVNSLSGTSWHQTLFKWR